nr:iron ABC transporter permease [Actinotalea sp. K2]
MGVRLAVLALVLGLLGLAVLASVAFGTRPVSLAEVFSALTGTGGLGEGSVVAEAAVRQRIPRTVLAMIIGASLAMAGAAMQAVTRNPLADPGILGVSGGAALAVVVGIVFFGVTGPVGYIVMAMGGAAAAAVLVYTIGSLGRGGASPLKLALAGAAMSAAFTSLVSAILLPRVDVMVTFRFWQIGGVGGAQWERIGAVAPFLLAGAVLVVGMASAMNSLALGDDLAVGLGVRVARTRLLASVGAVVLTGAATAIAGPIGFVGLVVPHAVRLLVGPDHRWLLPISALAGAALLTAADVVGRVVARPAEIEVGIITALIGAPVFIALVRRLKVREL